MPQRPMRAWIDDLEDEDVTFIKRFVLASGSLKEIARVYGVSYPTVRLRLDRLIQKITILDEAANESDFVRLLKLLYVDGKLDHASFKVLLDAHQKEMEG